MESCIATVIGVIAGIFWFIALGWTSYFEISLAGMIGGATGFVSYKPREVATVMLKSLRMVILTRRAWTSLRSLHIRKKIGGFLMRTCWCLAIVMIIVFNMLAYFIIPAGLVYARDPVARDPVSVILLFSLCWSVLILFAMNFSMENYRTKKGISNSPLGYIFYGYLDEKMSLETLLKPTTLRDLLGISLLGVPVTMVYFLIFLLLVFTDFVIFVLAKLAYPKRLVVSIASAMGSIGGCMDYILNANIERAYMIGIITAVITLVMPYLLAKIRRPVEEYAYKLWVSRPPAED